MRRPTAVPVLVLMMIGVACARSRMQEEPVPAYAPGECPGWRVEVFNRSQSQGVTVYYEVGARPDPTIGTTHDRTSALGWVAEGDTEVFLLTAPLEPQIVAKVNVGGLERTVRTGVTISVRCAGSRTDL